jgi:hypothetical protein
VQCLRRIEQYQLSIKFQQLLVFIAALIGVIFSDVQKINITPLRKGLVNVGEFK